MRYLVLTLGIASVALAADPPTDLVEQQFRRLDKNHDGKLSKEELKVSPLIAKLLEGADLDNDGFLTLDEVRLHLSTQFLGRDPKPGSKLDPIRVGPKILKPGDTNVGRQVPDIAFKDINGKAGKLSDLKDKKAIVVAFTSTSCPISKKYGPALARLEKAYRDKGVAFVFVDAIESDSLDDMKVAVKSQGFAGPYVHDNDSSFAVQMSAQATTDAFVLDSAHTVIYRGAVDDQYGRGYSHAEAKRPYLAEALDALLAGKTPTIEATEAPGCLLDVKKTDRKTSTTYYRDISRLVQTHCIECHRKNGVAPFPLETYKDVVAHAGEIKRVVAKNLMPPWFAAAPKDGTTPWINDRSLAKHEKEELLGWLNGNRAEGNKADAPLPRTFDPGWQIGKPDFIIKPDKPIKVNADGIMPYQNVVVESKLDQDRWVQALEVRPSQRQVVHHILVFVMPPKSAKGHPLDALRRNDGLTYYAIYVPGNSSVIYPDGFGKFFPKGSKVHFQIHYTPNGTATEDLPELGLVFAKEKPKHEVRVIPLVNPTFAIPPGADNSAVPAVLKLPFNAKILGFLPHMHLRGKAFRYEVTEPGGKPEVLLDVPRYDFNWQLLYNYAEPRGVPRGSIIKATGWFDNAPTIQPTRTRRKRSAGDCRPTTR